uniref:Lipase_3 domain-containing protein n=1 Tax=Caenorhabditis japonica TaxID=281687 RepID=A0A8R1DV77_CAEJA
MCQPWRTVLHVINCPIKTVPSNYNDTFNRHEIAYYILAANRVSNYSPVGAPMSCLMKIGANIQVIEEKVVPTTMEERSIGFLIGANHDLRHIFIGFRSTDDIFQFLAQYFVFTMGWMTDFPLGGKMVALYVQMYKDVLNNGFDTSLERAVNLFPSYTLLVTGHSLGGAMATIFSLHVAIKYPGKKTSLYSSSAPRSGDETFVKLLRERIFEEFRVVRDGDFVPDFPLRVSQVLPAAHHNSFEIFYPNHMETNNYKICDQPETETCLKGSWWKRPVAHAFLFDQNFFNFHGLGYCD